MKHDSNSISSLKCRIEIGRNFPDQLVSAVLPENNPINAETVMRINLIKLNHSSYFEFEGFTKLKTLRSTINDLLIHLELADKTWHFITDHHNEKRIRDK